MPTLFKYAGTAKCLPKSGLKFYLFFSLQIAVVKETGGKGPYCSLILAVVVMKDVLVFVCFALNVEFARMVRQWTLHFISRRKICVAL